MKLSFGIFLVSQMMTLISSKDPVAPLPRKLKTNQKKTKRPKTRTPKTKKPKTPTPNTGSSPDMGSSPLKSLLAFTDNVVNEEDTIIGGYLFNIENYKDNDPDGVEGLNVFRLADEDQQMCVVETSSLKSKVSFFIGQFTLIFDFSNIETIVFMLLDFKTREIFMLSDEVASALLRGNLGNSGLLGNVAGGLENCVNQYFDYVSDALGESREQNFGCGIFPRLLWIAKIVAACGGASVGAVTKCVIAYEDGGVSIAECLKGIIHVVGACKTAIDAGC